MGVKEVIIGNPNDTYDLKAPIYRGVGEAIRRECNVSDWSRIQAIMEANGLSVSDVHRDGHVVYFTCNPRRRNADVSQPVFDYRRPPLETNRPQPRDFAPGNYSRMDYELMNRFGIYQEDIEKARADAQKLAMKANQSRIYPDPYLNINGRRTFTRIIVSIEDHKTYVYNRDGSVAYIFKNSTGRPGHETETGIRHVVAIQSYGHFTGRNGSAANDMEATDNPFGPYRIVTDSEEGQFLHGMDQRSVLGRKISHGCVRHNNNDIMVLKSLVKEDLDRNNGVTIRIVHGFKGEPTTIDHLLGILTGN